MSEVIELEKQLEQEIDRADSSIAKLQLLEAEQERTKKELEEIRQRLQLAELEKQAIQYVPAPNPPTWYNPGWQQYPYYTTYPHYPIYVTYPTWTTTQITGYYGNGTTTNTVSYY